MKKKELLDMPLGDRMKHYEGLCETKIDPSSHIIVRVDGHKFSSFSKGFKKPFDFILSEAMRLTSMDMLEEFNAVTAYVQSDEITLIIPTLVTTEKHKGTNKPLWKHGYSGRVQKMVSLIAGFTTMSFNKHLSNLVDEDIYGEYGNGTEEERKYWDLLRNKKVGNAWFDCRIYGVQSDEEAFNSVMWRYRDCIKNSRSMHAQSYCSHKELHKLTGKEQSEYCLKKTGKDWNKISERYKSGIFIKKERYIKEAFNEQQDCVVKAERSRVISLTKEELGFSQENVDFIMKAKI